MSWSLSVSAVNMDPEVVGAAIDAEVARLKKQYEDNDYVLSAESEEQVAAAKDVAIALVKSGAIGTDKPVSISLSGHANADHQPATNYANDCITVTVSQATKPAS